MDTPSAPAHVEPEPPPTGLGALWKHLTDWATAWFWLPGFILIVYLIPKFAYAMSGVRPQENLDFLVGFSWQLIKCVLAIFFVELMRQQTGVWWKPEDLKSNPHLVWTQALAKCVTFFGFIYLLSH